MAVFLFPSRPVGRLRRRCVLLLLLAIGLCSHARAGHFQVDLGVESPSLVTTTYAQAMSSTGIPLFSQIAPTNSVSSPFAASGFHLGRAQPGIVGARSEVNLATKPSTRTGISTLYGGGVQARATVNDVILTGPAAAVGAALLFDVNGTVDAILNGSAQAAAEIVVTGSLFGPVPGGRAGVTRTVTFNSSTNGTLTFSTPSRQFLTGRPLEASLEVWIRQARVSVLQPFGTVGVQSGTLIVDFSNTVNFPVGGPVIAFGQQGFTANSAEANIVNNRWLGAASAPVPEPSCLLLIGMGGISLVSTRHWRASRRT